LKAGLGRHWTNSYGAASHSPSPPLHLSSSPDHISLLTTAARKRGGRESELYHNTNYHLVALCIRAVQSHTICYPRRLTCAPTAQRPYRRQRPYRPSSRPPSKSLPAALLPLASRQQLLLSSARLSILLRCPLRPHSSYGRGVAGSTLIPADARVRTQARAPTTFCDARRG